MSGSFAGRVVDVGANRSPEASADSPSSAAMSCAPEPIPGMDVVGMEAMAGEEVGCIPVVMGIADALVEPAPQAAIVRATAPARAVVARNLRRSRGSAGMGSEVFR
ncbi:hypothetical protein FAIPA1_690008 [Frankia sp. AiPs1]